MTHKTSEASNQSNDGDSTHFLVNKILLEKLNIN
jgi:hypothetical protein